MFRQRKKQTFAEGTFIATKPRVLAIIQLCLAFTAFLLLAGKPFMTDHYQIKSEMLIYEYVMGKQNNNQAELFHSLPNETQDKIHTQYETLLKKASTGFLGKIQKSCDIIFFEAPSFERTWIFFGVLIPILLLKKVEGARHAIWILPLITLAYLINNHLHGIDRQSELDKLFPSEHFLETRYLKIPINSLAIAEQQKAILKTWQLYLVEFYTKEIPSEKREIFHTQVLKGDFAFNLERLEKSFLDKADKKDEDKIPPALAGLYLTWNCLLAASTLEFKMRKTLKEIQNINW
jgi:hypothetical protein